MTKYCVEQGYYIAKKQKKIITHCYMEGLPVHTANLICGLLLHVGWYYECLHYKAIDFPLHVYWFMGCGYTMRLPRQVSSTCQQFPFPLN